MKQRLGLPVERGQFLCDVRGRAERLVAVEVLREVDLVAHVALWVRNPGIRDVGQHLALHEVLDVFAERYALCVAELGIRLGLSVAALDLLAVAVEERSLHRHLPVAEEVIGVDLDMVALLEGVKQSDDLVAEFRGNLAALVVQALLERCIHLAGVDELDLAFAALLLDVGQDPDVGGDARVEEHLLGQRDEGLELVVLDDHLPGVALAAASVAGEQGRAVGDDGDAAAPFRGRLHLVEHVLDEQQLPVAHAGLVGEATRDVCLDLGLLLLPNNAVRRIGQLVAELLAFVQVVGEGVAQTNVPWIGPRDKQVALGNGEGLLIDLLTEQLDDGIRMLLLDELLGHRQHAARAAAEVINTVDGARLVETGLFPRKQQPRHQTDHIARGEMLSRSLVRLLIGNSDELLEQETHAVIVVAVRAEGLPCDGVHHVPEQSRPLQLLHHLAEVEGLHDLLDLLIESVDIGLPIVVNLLWVLGQPDEVVSGDVVEIQVLPLRPLRPRPQHCIQLVRFQPALELRMGRPHTLDRGLQHAIEAPEHHKGHEDVSNLAVLERTA